MHGAIVRDFTAKNEGCESENTVRICGEPKPSHQFLVTATGLEHCVMFVGSEQAKKAGDATASHVALFGVNVDRIYVICAVVYALLDGVLLLIEGGLDTVKQCRIKDHRAVAYTGILFGGGFNKFS